LHLNTFRGRLSLATVGQIHGHNAAADAFSCAATPAVGPFPNPFNAGNVTETFSSDGPRRIFFQPDGTPYTPGNFSSTGGILRQKPDITAADGVSVTGVGGFPSPFFGTSAAAPHAAAIAGLLKSANPALTPAQIRTTLTSTAIDIMTPGVDRNSGAGIIDAYAATQSLGIPGTAFLQLGTITANEDPGDGNGSIDAGENANMVIQLRNDGVNSATAISATLASSTPGVTIIAPNTSAYPDLAAGGGSGTNLTLFHFSVASFVLCPTVLDFTLTVNLTGGPTEVLKFSVVSGPSPVNIVSTIDTIAPAPGPGFTGTTGIIPTRHFRDGVPGACNTKAFPGTTAPGNRQFDAYTFQTCPNSGPTCVTVTLSGANAANLFTAAYSGSFNPADLSQNYLTDAGFSTSTTTYSFNLPGGQQTFVIVVYDVPVGPPSGSTYTLNVSGSCVTGVCHVIPVMAASDSTLVNESCPPANNAIDPGERVTVSLKLANNGNGPTSNLVATLQSNAGVVAPSNPQSYGAIAAGGNLSRDFSFTALGNCGDLITATLKLQDGANDFGQVSYSFRLGVSNPVVLLSENFDGVTPPALPAGWSTTASGIEVPWVTSTTNPFSAPNDAFAPDVANIGNTELVSPSIHILSAVAQLGFRNAYNLENTFDGGVLEISINGGPYQDIIAAGGSFVSGGYNGTVSSSFGNPIAGRSAWTGLSAGTTTTPAYLNTVVNLPAAAAGQDVQLKWRVGTDNVAVAAGPAPGQRIDNITVTDANFVCTSPCGGVRLVVTSSLSRANASIVVGALTIQNIGSVTANNVLLTGVKLGATNGTPLPQSLGNLAPGAIVSTFANFTNSTPGTASSLTVSGNYAGGPFGGSRRVTIP
jgi:hypothetical protein